MFKILLRPSDGGDLVEVALDRAAQEQPQQHAARVGEHRLEVELESAGAGAGWLRLRGSVFPFHAARVGEQLHVWLAGRTYILDIVERTPRRAADAAAAAASSTVTAPMPGTILRILVAAGDVVQPHQPLIIMESMKMEMTLSVPHVARVREVSCRERELAALGAVLLHLEEADEAETA